MRSAAILLGLCLGTFAVGCGYPPLPAPDDGAGPNACVSFARLLDTCRLTFDGDLSVMGLTTYNTDTHVLTIDGVEAPAATNEIVMIEGVEVDVISARNVRIAASGKLRGVGTRPLAIIASDTLTVETDAQIDVSDGGAGAQTSCGGGATVGQISVDGAGGGGGGGYGADGGDGGSGNKGGAPTQGGMKGAASPMPMGLRGGCPGAAGGDGDAPGGAGGAGGGALYVAAANRIELNSFTPITVGGGGGKGGQRNTNGDAGGGGGGSGGILILEAPHIVGTNVTIAANGGGGGEGSDDFDAGNDGSPGTVSTSLADGGRGGANTGADGGRGGSRDLTAGESVTVILDGGGRGGGGGVGFIRIISLDVQGVTTSPRPHALNPRLT